MFYRIFITDIKKGVLGQWKRYLLSFGYFFLCSLVFYFKWGNYWSDKGILSHSVPTLGDYLLFFFGGCDQYIFDFQRPFIFPVQWLILVLLAAYLNLDYFYESLSGIGIYTLLQSRDRKKWWISKCLCTVANVVLYMLLGIATTMLSCAFLSGDFSLSIHSIMSEILELLILVPKLSIENIFLCCILVSLSILAICLLQLFLSLIMKPLLSFLCIAFLLILSSYFMTPFLLGNYAMVVRSSFFSNNGLEAIYGFLSAGALCLITVVGGGIWFARKDILNKGE